MKKVIFLSFLFLVFLTTNSFAIYVDVELDSSTELVWYKYNNPNGNYTQHYAGNYDLNFKTDEDSTTYYSTFGFCIDLSVESGSGLANLEEITTENYKKAAWILDNHWNYNNSKTQNAGIQLAIWHFVYETPADMFIPAFGPGGNGSGDAYDLYRNYKKNLEDNYDNSFDASGYRIVDFTEGQQDMITVNPVPEPATMALFGLGLLGISLVGRKRR